MTAEQAKQLKKGAKILIEADFWGVHADGDIQFGFTSKSLSGDRQMSGEFVIPEHVSLMPEKPKYDPCRPFKKGDKVEYSPRNGRDFFDMPWVYNAAFVIEDEYRSGLVVVRFTFNYGEPSVHKVPWFYLQLVTPVEELEPYSVEESGGGATLNCFIVKRGEKHVSYYLYKGGNANHYYTYEQAKARAEAERDRLNAEIERSRNDLFRPYQSPNRAEP